MGDLVLQNVIHVTTQNGQCQVELLTGDITKLTLEEKVDMVMVSAFPGDYQASHGTLIAALDHELGISVRKLAMDKEMDLRKHFHCWLSKPLPKHIPYTRLLCFERQMTHIGVHPAALVGDVFRGLTPIFNNHDSSIITPLLATGDQKFSLSVMMRAMVDAACNWMKAGLPLRCLKIVLFTRTPDSLTKQDQEVVSLFTKLKHKWEKRGASLKVSSMQYDIYISYSHKDAQLVTVVRKLIEKKHGALRIFSEKQEIWAELAWQEAMFEKMTACKRIVALLSPSYLESSECMEQFNIALCCTRLQTHTLLAPLYVETVPTMPAYMQLVQYIDCREDPPELTIEIQLRLACDLIANSISENSSATEGELVDTIYAYDIFISYSHRHPQEAEHLVDAFSQNCPDTKVFFDRSGLETGKSWQKTLYSVLGRVRCVVAMVTTPYLESSVCQEEYNIALYRAMTQVDDFLFIPICIDADLNALPVEFAAVRPLDGRGPSFPSLTEELQRDVVSWLKDGKRTPLFPPVEVVKDVNSITKRCRQEQVRKQYLMQKHLLESNSLMPKNGESDIELPKPGMLVKPYEKPSCDVYFCFSQNDTRLAAILGHMITGNSPDLNVSLGVGTPQERLQKLDTAKLIVVFVSQTFMASGQLSDALHMSLCRRRAEENPFLVYSILSSSLDLDPVFLHLLPYDLSLIDSVWEELGTEDQKIFSHRTVVAKGELQGSYRCSHSELLALKKAELDITENMTRIRSESAPSAPQLSVNFINIERERRRLKKLPIHTIVPLKQALWQWTPSRPKKDGKVNTQSLATDAETKDVSVPVQDDTVAGGSVEVLSGVEQSENKTSGCVPCVEKKTNTNASDNPKKTNTNASDNAKKMKANASEDTQKTNTNASDNAKRTNTTVSDSTKKMNTNASDNANKTNTNASEDTQKTNTNASDNAQSQKPSHRRSNACALL